jgi:hypothetical protein
MITKKGRHADIKVMKEKPIDKLSLEYRHFFCFAKRSCS